MKLVFQLRSFILFLVILGVEICIALFVRDKFIRPYFGDVLAVIGVFYLAQTFIKSSALKIASGAFVFACIVEAAQYFRLVKLLGIEHNKILCIILGTGFEWLDIAAYFAGAVFALILSRVPVLNGKDLC